MVIHNFVLRTPLLLKTLIIITSVISLLSPLVSMILSYYFNLPGPTLLFPLSRYGILQGWLWQPATYFWLSSESPYITLGLLSSIFFHMFTLWFTGIEILPRVGKRFFLLLYLGSALLATLPALALQLGFSSKEILVGSTPPILACLTFWGLMHPERELFLFMLLRIRTKMLVLLTLFVIFLSNLSSAYWIAFLSNFTAILFAFFLAKLKFSRYR